MISSFACFSTLLCRVTVSRAQPLFALVTSCLIAVRNPANIPQERHFRISLVSIQSQLMVTFPIWSLSEHALPPTNCLNQSGEICWDSIIFLWAQNHSDFSIKTSVYSIYWCKTNLIMPYSAKNSYSPCGLKKPVIQKVLGLPSNTQLKNCLFLSRSSVNQKPSVDDSQEIFLHRFGTRASKILSRASRRF